MYLEYWGLRDSPFVNVPSRDFFFESPQHREAITRLLYVIDYRKGAALLTGEVGCGKTTVIRNLAAHLPRNRYEMRVLSNPALSPVDLIRGILIQFGLTVKGNSKAILLEQLRRKLEGLGDQSGGAVLVIDEAHVIDNRSVLEELRMLLNLQAGDRFLMTLILVGQPPLVNNIEVLQPLKERIGMKYHLAPLDREQTAGYVRYRVGRVGGGDDLFTESALTRIFDYSRGIPLKINNLCDRCFLMGMMNNLKLMDADTVDLAAQDLEQEAFC